MFAFLSMDEIAPLFVFGAIVAGTFWVLSMISSRNSQAEDRLERLGRPKSLVEIEMSQLENKNKYGRSQGHVLQPRRLDAAEERP